jgi:hypothetical protein
VTTTSNCYARLVSCEGLCTSTNPVITPKFFGNDVTTVEEHLDNFWACFQTHSLNNDDEDIVMRLFSATFVEDARRWYNSLPDKSIKTWDSFHKVFIKIWGTKGDPNMLLQLSEMKNKENETVKEFDTRFERLLQQIPDNISPKDDLSFSLYQCLCRTIWIYAQRQVSKGP